MRTPTHRRHLPVSRTAAAAAGLSAIAALGATGCHTVGPESIRAGRSLYNEAIAVTSTEQLMLNLVRLRYRDVPVFLEVTSVSTNFSLQSRAGTGLTLGFGGNGDSDEFGLSGGIQFDERPTITYLPLQGEAFATRLLTPIQPRVLVLLANSGWAIDRIFSICVQQLGPLVNATSASGPTPDAAPDFDRFDRFIVALRTIQREHSLSLSVITGGSGDSAGGDLLGITVPPSAIGTPEYREAAELLGLDAGRVNADGSRTLVCSLTAAAGGDAADSDRVAIVTRSVMSALFFLSQAVDADPEHVERGLITVTREADGAEFDWGRLLGRTFRVKVGESLPVTAGPSVRHLGRWFWIEESDLTSKSTLSLMQQLFALQAGDIDGAGPILTLPLTN
jgi:hypothetical protein